jgi:hypothetical protein
MTIKNSCYDCLWSEKYFRGLLCNWAINNNIHIPPYLVDRLNINDCFPYQLDQKDLGDRCREFKKSIVENR